MWDDMFTSPLHACLVTLAPGEECEGNAFGSVSLSVCMSVRARNSKTIAPINLIFFTQEVLYPWLSPPLRRSGSGSGSGLKKVFKGILHHCEKGQNMPPKKAITSNVAV